MDVNMRSFEQSLQNTSDQQLDEIHKKNLSDLDNLTKKLKDSMTVLDAQPAISNAIPPRGNEEREDIPDINVRVGDFGNSTYAAQR